jgi:Tripartite tricarboxylate transporter family receptor
MFTQPLPLYVLAGSPFKSYADALAYARANPGRFRWGTAGSRGIGEILMASGFQHAKVETVTVPFKAGVDANTALLGGHIEAVASTDFGPLLQAGKVRLLVETGPVKIPTASTLQLDACLTNLLIQEIYPYRIAEHFLIVDFAPEREIRGGYAPISDRPGLGVTLVADKVRPFLWSTCDTNQ